MSGEVKPPTDDELRQWRALAEAASNGPWGYSLSGSGAIDVAKLCGKEHTALMEGLSDSKGGDPHGGRKTFAPWSPRRSPQRWRMSNQPSPSQERSVRCPKIFSE